MVVRIDVGNTEAQRHHVQESRIGQLRALCAEIVARGEFQFVHAGGKVGAFQQRLVAAAVVVGDHGLQGFAAIVDNFMESNRHPLSGRAGSGVKNMGGQASHRICPFAIGL
ncbi:hypothetical protein D3C81_1704930 [compost metagenome]